MEWLNFRHLYAFWSVCRHGGFSRASERIFVSQSTVSEQVSLLEDYLGEELLERSTRTLKVTDRGAALLAYADDIFSKSYEINRIFRDKSEALSPSNIRIGMVGGVSRNFVYGLVSNALKRQPGTRIDIVDGSFDELTELLRSFDLDLIFSLDRPRQKDLVTVSHRRVSSSPVCIAGTPDLVRKLRRRRVHPLPMNVYMFRHPFDGPPFEELLEQVYRLDVKVPVHTDDISLLRFLANGGRGVAVMPQIGVLEDLNAGRVSQVELDSGPKVDIFAVFLTQGVRRQLIEEFLP